MKSAVLNLNFVYKTIKLILKTEFEIFSCSFCKQTFGRIGSSDRGCCKVSHWTRLGSGVYSVFIQLQKAVIFTIYDNSFKYQFFILKKRPRFLKYFLSILFLEGCLVGWNGIRIWWRNSRTIRPIRVQPTVAQQTGISSST